MTRTAALETDLRGGCKNNSYQLASATTASSPDATLCATATHSTELPYVFVFPRFSFNFWNVFSPGTKRAQIG